MFFFFFNDTATTEIYTLSLHDALPISSVSRPRRPRACPHRASTPEHPGHANQPDPSRCSTATGSVSTVSIAPPSATTRPSRSDPAKGHSGRAVAYPDPKIVTVAAPINTVNATRPPQAHPHAQRRGSSPTSSSPEAVNTSPPTGACSASNDSATTRSAPRRPSPPCTTRSSP